jgi:Zn-finger nucleic acid-binding protein
LHPNQFMQCPKCHGAMRTYNRGGLHIEQCDSCRGIFLDHGEMEALVRIETQWTQPGHGQPAWGVGHPGHHGHHGHGNRSFGKMLFSS